MHGKATIKETGDYARDFFIMAEQRNSALGHLIFEVSKSRTFRHTTCGRIPLDEGSSRRRNLYLTKHNIHKGQKSILPVRIERGIAASER